jgi:exodeoxyribonuclease VII large subunit
LARAHPRRRLNDWLQRLDDLQAGLSRSARVGARRQRLAWQNLWDRLCRARPALLLKQRRQLLCQTQERLREQTLHRLRESRNRLDALATRLRLLGPEQVLARGYSITMDAQSGAVLRAATEARPGQRLKTRLKTGGIASVVE